MGPGAPVIWHTAPMADTDRPDGTDEGPSLEMPSFSLKRKKKAPEEAEPGVAAPPEPTPAPTAEPTAETVKPTAEQAPAPPVVHEPVDPVEPPTAVVPPVPSQPEPETAPETVAHPRARRLPTVTLSGIPAAAATGVVVGGLAVLLSWLATSACDVVRGTSSCGGGPGLLILVVVLGLLAYVGGLLLRIFGVPDAGSTSLLAVGILAVLVLVFLLGSIDEWWMVVAIPVAAVIAYCASWWVTTSVVGGDGDTGASGPEPHDVR